MHTPPTARRLVAGLATATLAAGLLSGCGSEDGRATLNWYVNPDGVETLKKLAASCSSPQYRIDVRELPASATDQRTQLARRLAARDSSTDLMSLDPVFVPEFASAGWLAPLDGKRATNAVDDDVLDGAAETVTWEDDVVAFPQWANTQVLWYRKSLAKAAGLDMSKPVTWQQIIEAAADNGGTVGVQADKYEGYSVWITALVQGAGGSIVENPEAGTDAKVMIDSEEGRKAAEVIQRLAHSDAAQPDLTVSNEGTSLGLMYAVDKNGDPLPGEFMVNWTFAYSNYKGLIGKPGGPADKSELEDLGWARYPQTVAGEDSKPPIGGIDIGVGAYSEHPEYAMEAASCVTSGSAQVKLAVNDGLMPSRASAYEDPALTDAYPADLLDLFQESIDEGGPRPRSAYYAKISGALQATWHSPKDVDPDRTPKKSANYLKDVLSGEALL